MVISTLLLFCSCRLVVLSDCSFLYKKVLTNYFLCRKCLTGSPHHGPVLEDGRQVVPLNEYLCNVVRFLEAVVTNYRVRQINF